MIAVRNQVTGEEKNFPSKQAISNFIAAGANPEDYKDDLTRLGPLPLPTEMSQANHMAFAERVRQIAKEEGLDSPDMEAQLMAGRPDPGQDTPPAVGERADRHLGGNSDVPGAAAQAQVDAPKNAEATLKAQTEAQERGRSLARAQAKVEEARKELTEKNLQEYSTPADKEQQEADLAEGERKNAAVRAAAAGAAVVYVNTQPDGTVTHDAGPAVSTTEARATEGRAKAEAQLRAARTAKK